MNNDIKGSLQNFYESHHEQGKRLGRSMYQQTRAKLFKQWVGTGHQVLDLGGRDGTLTQYFAEGNSVTIGDVDSNALAIAQKEHGFGIQLVNLNEYFPFDDDSFDVVVMAEVLEHLPYPEITLSEIRRVLKKGGTFIGNVPLAYHLKDIWKVVRGKKLTISSDPTHLQFMNYYDLKELLLEFFTIEEIEVIHGGKKARLFPRLFARNVAFKCKNPG